MNDKEFERLLLSVQKPGRYSGGEINSVVKDKNKVDVRFAFCFPNLTNATIFGASAFLPHAKILRRLCVKKTFRFSVLKAATAYAISIL